MFRKRKDKLFTFAKPMRLKLFSKSIVDYADSAEMCDSVGMSCQKLVEDYSSMVSGIACKEGNAEVSLQPVFSKSLVDYADSSMISDMGATSPQCTKLVDDYESFVIENRYSQSETKVASEFLYNHGLVSYADTTLSSDSDDRSCQCQNLVYDYESSIDETNYVESKTEANSIICDSQTVKEYADIPVAISSNNPTFSTTISYF